LKDAVKIKNRLGNEVDLDVDIPKLFHAMHQRVLELLRDAKNTQFLQQAKDLLEDMLEIIPKHAIALYNLSCVESLLGNTKEAVKRLRDAIFEGGYRDFKHMEKDEDLNNIRNTEEYQELLQTVESDIQNESPVPTEVEQAEVEQPANPIEQSWTHVEATQAVPPEQVPQEPVRSVGEVKWAEAIELLTNMGFANGPYSGPRFVVLLEKYNGDLALVINDLLNENL